MPRYTTLKRLATYLTIAAAASGCSGDTKSSSSAAGSAGPKLSSTDPAEHAAAAREAAEKYGAQP
ncbi:MAG: hypothetical protein QM775_30260 [Pirellulales bacterium]